MSILGSVFGVSPTLSSALVKKGMAGLPASGHAAELEKLKAESSALQKEIVKQREEQELILGNILTAQKQRTQNTKDSLQQQSATLEAALGNILQSFSGFSDEAEQAASGALSSAEKLKSERLATATSSSRFGTANLLSKKSTSNMGSSAVGSQRKLTQTSNTPGNVFGVR